MKKVICLLPVLFVFLATSCEKKRAGNPKVLIFSKTMGFEHASIPQGIAALQELGAENNFEVDTTKNAGAFTDETLKQYSAIIFLSTTGNVLDNKQEAAFERYIQAGGGFVGIHAATDTEYDWGWYNKLVGGQFLSHPAGTPEADFIIKNRNFIATAFFTDTIWRRTDELYNFKKLNPDVNVLMTVDESTYEGGENGDYHPMSWYHDYDGGRAFYTAGGHTDESFSEELFLKHLLGGIQYAIGENLELDYDKATTQIPPDADRFSKEVLVQGEFFEPIEMAVLPNNDVLIAQRRGEILLYSDKTKELAQVAYLDVYHKALNAPGVNVEEGLMGLQKDPDYANNHWIYAYYAPTGDQWVNRLSRFKFRDGEFDLDSEQVILEVESQREICCHTAGSIAFGGDGLLYVSTGDNSTPFDEPNAQYVNKGYAPLNDLPGKEQYDARRSSGNTNDLRGKILRIKVNEDGSYDIPKGNLFPVGTENARPEIYTMGHRNPYRISVDPKNGYLYWGDVGPDAQEDNPDRGPRGYDEVGQARAAGNFGWPLFVGDNRAYVDYDYATGESGDAFDTAKPINDSRNNTGLQELPPAQPAMVYYPYAPTQDFPQVGTGGRNAMAGPVYYSDLYASGGLPDYYDGKPLIYEWIRGWMMAVTLFDDGTFNKMEPFAPEVRVQNLIDMEMSDDGRVYLLEYGSGWFTPNEDSGLSYIVYNGGNRPPLIDSFSVDKTSGKLPLEVVATIEAHDREGDEISYVWNFGNGETYETNENKVRHTYSEPGEYKITVEVKDGKGGSLSSDQLRVTAGNSRPLVSIDLKGGNSSFFMAGVPVEYEVSVADPDRSEDIDFDNIFVSVDYLEGMDQVNMSLGHQQVSAAVMGRALTQSMDCKTCHKEREASVGPNYFDVATKYKDREDALAYLQKKITEGGSGVWGEVMMPAHPTITQDESRQIALYIKSLAGDVSDEKSMPPSGRFVPNPTEGTNVMVLTASYTDKGVGNAPPLTGVASAYLQSSTITFSKDTKNEGFTHVKFGGMDLLTIPENEGWFALDDIDLTGVKNVELTVRWQAPPTVGLQFEVRKDAVDGQLLGVGTMPAPLPGQPSGSLAVQLNKTLNEKVEALYFVHKPIEGQDRGGVPIALMNVHFN
ncbi:ThuA domain-containing protein [Allomuricauda sp. SCSIO 65647]|uniref:ThuA domain-containing protein n=1 Tax=Allomuricauda sp. SCSIO 65647 TaxID=2908843 RepID=UPI001F3F5EBE|nr:ThuA domain-containing protein [Muricauda sp. SCSIO 65647]UJH67736.1 ThuA domain-containing protein [Muricauda sp. SCSIO 65647]